MNSVGYLLAALEDHAQRWEEAAVKIASLFPMPGPESETEYWSMERRRYLANAHALRGLKAKLAEELTPSKIGVI